MSLTGRIVQEIALQVKGLDDAKKLDAQIKELENKKAKVTVDADTTAAQRRLDEIDRNIDSLNNERAKVEVDADTSTADRKLDEIDRQIKDLENDKAKVDVDADTTDADRKLDEINRQIAELKDDRAIVEVDADTTTADRKLDEIDRELSDLRNERAVVEVDADTADADRKLKEIDRQLGTLRTQKTRVDVDAAPATGALSGLQATGSKVFGALTSVAGGFALAAGAAIAGFAKNAVDDFEDAALGAGRLRDALGLSAQEASRWTEVAGDIGISAQSIETAFGKVLIAIGKSPPGGVFGELAVRSEDGALQVNETILNVIDHLNQIKDPAERATEAQKLLGKGWKDAAELIEAGSDQVRESLASVGDAKIMSDAQIDQGREFRDQLDNLSDKAEELSIAVGGTLVPALGDLASAAATVVAPFQTFFEVLGAAKSIPVLGTYLKLISGPIGAATTSVSLLKDGFVSLFGLDGPPPNSAIDTWFDELPAKFEAGNKATDENIARQKEWIATLEAGNPTIGIYAELLEGARRKLFELESQQKNLVASKQVQDVFVESAKAAEDAVDAQFDLAASIADTADALDTAALASEGFTSALDKIDAASELDFSLMAIDTVKSFDDIKGALEDAQQAGADWSKVDLTPESVDELKGITPELEAVTESIRGMRESIQTELTAAFDTGGIQGYRDKATFFAGEIRDQFVQSFKDAGASEDEAVAKTEELLRALGLLPEQVEIQVKLSQAEAARKTLEIFKTDIDNLPTDVRTEIKTLWAQGSTVEALQKLNDYLIAHGQTPIDIDSIINPPADPPAIPDIPPVEISAEFASTADAVATMVDGAQQAVDGTPVDIPVGTDTTVADGEFRNWIDDANATTATPTLDANGMPADAVLDGWKTDVTRTTSKATLDANGMPADRVVDGWKTNANSARGTGVMGAVRTAADAVVDAWQTETNRTTATATANAKLGTYPSSADIVRAIGPVVVQAKVVAVKLFDLAKGGTAPADGALAGEAGAEFIREPGRAERLLTSPSWVPPGTRVTSARRTRDILVRRGGLTGSGGHTTIPRALRHLPRYAGGGTVAVAAAVPTTTIINQTTNVNAAVVGSRYDVAKAVGQGTRDLRRLVGARGTSAR